MTDITCFFPGVLEKGLIRHSGLQVCSHLRGWRPHRVPVSCRHSWLCFGGTGSAWSVGDPPPQPQAQHICCTQPQPAAPTLQGQEETQRGETHSLGNVGGMGSEGMWRGDCERRRRSSRNFRTAWENTSGKKRQDMLHLVHVSLGPALLRCPFKFKELDYKDAWALQSYRFHSDVRLLFCPELETFTEL